MRGKTSVQNNLQNELSKWLKPSKLSHFGTIKQYQKELGSMPDTYPEGFLLEVSAVVHCNLLGEDSLP